MEGFTKVAEVGEIPVGSMKTVMVGGKKIALANIDGEFFAIDDACTHAGCSLGSSPLDGSVVHCSCHGAQFDVMTGKVLSLPAMTDVTRYAVKVENGEVYIMMSSRPPSRDPNKLRMDSGSNPE